MTYKRKNRSVWVIVIAMLPFSLIAQNIYWIDSAYESPRIIKTAADGTELASSSLPAGSMPQSVILNAMRDGLLLGGLRFADANITYLSTDFTAQRLVISSQSAIRGLGVDEANNKIYWTTTNLIEGSKIWQANADGTSPTVLIDFGPESNDVPRAIALDSKNEMIYWTNFSRGKIQRSGITPGSALEEVIAGLDGPAGLAIDSDSGKIFWTEFYGHRIGTADLGGNAPSIVLKELSYPNSIAISHEKNRMVWTEFAGNVKSANLDGSHVFDYGVSAIAPSGVVIESFPASVDQEDEMISIPKEFRLSQNFPNPFNPQTRIEFDIAKEAHVHLQIFNTRGQLIRTLVDEEMSPGTHSVFWDGSNVPSGLYFYRLTAESFSQTRKMMLLQ